MICKQIHDSSNPVYHKASGKCLDDVEKESAQSLDGSFNDPQLSRDAASVDTTLNDLNEKLLWEVNRRGKVFLSHTKLRGSFTLRLAIGNIRTTRDHVKLAWDEMNEVLAEMEERRVDI